MKRFLKKIGPIYRLYKLAMRESGRYRLKRLAKQRPCRIIIGAERTSQQGWIPTEIEFLNLLRPDDWKRCFMNDSIDAMLAEHVWEHLAKGEAIVAARTCFQYLKPGGYLRVAVPDGLHPNPSYREWVKPGGVGLYAEDHKILYTYQTLKEVFELAGFKVEILEHFDEKGEFHYSEWDLNGGMIRRSKRFDPRNRNGEFNYTSLILDAWK